MPRDDTDRNLLFGVLALQLDLIDAGQFAEACSAWAARKDGALADLLSERGWVLPADRADVDRLLRRKLERNGGDARRSLSSLVGRRAEEGLASVDDFEVHSVLTEVSAGNTCPALVTVDSPPETRDQYPLIRLHAQGGLGRVWLARDPVLGRDLALKELRPGRDADPGNLARFVQEARITGQLEHPGVVTVHQLASRPGGGGPFYTMRFVRGRTLTAAAREHHRNRQACAAGPLELTGLLNAFVAACNAVGYAHSRGVIHRDLKGQNIILGDYGDVVVLDWGLAKLVDRPEPDMPTPPVVLDVPGESGYTSPGQLLGTPGYMAPEQIEGRQDLIGPGCDIYGLGAVLYEILTGRPPHAGLTAAEALRKVCEEEPPPARHVCPAADPALEAVCRRAMARRPEDRYESAAELARDVQRWLVDEPVSAYRDPPSARLGRWARRHRSAVTAAAALLVAAVGVLSVGTVVVVHEQGRTAAALRGEAAQRKRAEANYRLAREAVDRMYYEALGHPLLFAPRMDPLRKLLLATVLKSYQRLMDGSRSDFDLRYHLGCTYLRYSRVAREQGALDEAAACGETALATLAALVRDAPSNTEYSNDLANCHLDLGDVYRDGSQTGRAESSFRSALEIWARLARGQDPGRFRQSMAAAYDALGSCYQATGRLDLAASAHGESLKIWQAISEPGRGGPESFAARYHTAVCHGHLAGLAFRRGDWGQAVASFRLASTILERVQAEHPKDSYRNRLAYLYQGLGKALEKAGDRDGAVSNHARSLEVWQGLVDDHPDVVEYRYNLATSHRTLGDLGDTPGDRPRAESHYQDALKVCEALAREHPENTQVSHALAMTSFSLGRYYLAARRQPEARSAFRKASAVWESLKGDERAEYERDYRPSLRSYLDGLESSAPE